MAKTVQDYQIEITNAQNEISKLQAECKHPNYELVMWSWRPGASYPTRLCKECRGQLPGITEEEARTTIDNSYKPFTQVGDANG
jgi:hypothetical protein